LQALVREGRVRCSTAAGTARYKLVLASTILDVLSAQQQVSMCCAPDIPETLMQQDDDVASEKWTGRPGRPLPVFCRHVVRKACAQHSVCMVIRKTASPPLGML
jgi:hypothetical protein